MGIPLNSAPRRPPGPGAGAAAFASRCGYVVRRLSSCPNPIAIRGRGLAPRRLARESPAQTTTHVIFGGVEPVLAAYRSWSRWRNSVWSSVSRPSSSSCAANSTLAVASASRRAAALTYLNAHAPLAAAAPSVRRGLRDPGLRAPLAAPWPGSGHLGRGLAGVDAVVLRDRAGDAGAGAGLGGRRGQRGAAGPMPAKIRLPGHAAVGWRGGVRGKGACSAKFGRNLPW